MQGTQYGFRPGASAKEKLAGYIRVNCVKVRDGKGLEFSAYLRDLTAKLSKARVDAGEQDAAVVAQAVEPAGPSARCDYHLVSLYRGFPTWAAPGQGMPMRAMWNEVHLEMDWADYFGRINAVADRAG